MIITLPTVSAMALVSTKWCASTDAARPILTGVLLEWDATGDSPWISSTATDSYALAHRKVYAAEFAVEDGEPTAGTVLVRAKELFDAVKKATVGKAPKVILFVEGTDNREGKVDGPRGSVTVCDFAMKSSVTLDPIEGTFPTWRSLFDPDVPAMETIPAEVHGVALNPGVFDRAAKAAYAVRPGEDPKYLVLRPSNTKKDARLIPWQFGMDDPTVGPFRAIAMPVRAA